MFADDEEPSEVDPGQTTGLKHPTGLGSSFLHTTSRSPFILWPFDHINIVSILLLLLLRWLILLTKGRPLQQFAKKEWFVKTSSLLLLFSTEPVDRHSIFCLFTVLSCYSSMIKGIVSWTPSVYNSSVIVWCAFKLLLWGSGHEVLCTWEAVDIMSSSGTFKVTDRDYLCTLPSQLYLSEDPILTS